MKMNGFKFFVLGIFFALLISPSCCVDEKLAPLPLTHLPPMDQSMRSDTLAGLENILQNIEYLATCYFGTFIQETTQISKKIKLTVTKEQLAKLSQTTYEFRYKLCESYLENFTELQNEQLNSTKFRVMLFEIIDSAIDKTFNIYRSTVAVKERISEMLNVIRRRNPLFFLNFATGKIGTKSELLSFRIEFITTMFYFGWCYFERNTQPDKQNYIKGTYNSQQNLSASNDEAHEYNNFVFEVICHKVKYLVGDISNSSHPNSIAKAEIKMFPKVDLEHLLDTSQIFKKILCDDFIEAVLANPVLNPPKFVTVEQMPSLNEVQLQIGWEAFYSLKIVCEKMLIEYKKRTDCKQQLDGIQNVRPLIAIFDVHRKTMDAIRGNLNITRDDWNKCIQQSHKTVFSNGQLSIQKNIKISDIFAEIDEPGLGDENVNYDLTSFDDIWTKILEEFNEKIKTAKKYNKLRRRLIDFRYKSPTRFRAIVCTEYKNGLTGHETPKQLREHAYGLINKALDQMFMIYSNRFTVSFNIKGFRTLIGRYSINKLTDKKITEDWRLNDAPFLMFFMHFHVLTIGKDGADHMGQFIVDLRASQPFNFKKSEIFQLP